jgi:hypothetical protein
MNDIIFIKNEADYIKYSQLKPKTLHSYKKVKFICSICNNESVKTFRQLSIPFICTKCLQILKANSDITKEKRKQTNIKKFGTEFASQSDICKQHLINTCKEKYNVNNPFQIASVKDHIKENNLKAYGCENPFQSELIKEKIKQTCLEKYGTEFYVQSDEFKEKSHLSCLEKYNVEHYSKTNEYKIKFSQTCMDKYGVNHNAKTPEFKEKYKNTCLTKYNVENIMYLDEMKDKIKQICLDKYNVEHPMQNEATKQKIKNTCLERYGVENAMQNHTIFSKQHKKYIYNDLQFDSSWELAYYIWLKDNNIDFEYQPNISFDYEYAGKIHKYFPDFKVNDEYIEIKGTQFIKENKMICPFDKTLNDLFNAKYQCMKNNNIKIILYDEIKYYLNYIKVKYGKKYLKQFKNN